MAEPLTKSYSSTKSIISSQAKAIYSDVNKTTMTLKVKKINNEEIINYNASEANEITERYMKIKISDLNATSDARGDSIGVPNRAVAQSSLLNQASSSIVTSLNKPLNTYQENLHSNNLVESDTDSECADWKEYLISYFDTLFLTCLLPDCYHVVDSKEKLYDHMKISHEMDRCKCLQFKCDQSFEKSTVLADHINQVHSDITRWQCSQCADAFDKYDYLSHHINLYHNGGLFQCGLNDCCYQAKYRIEMIQHYRFAHDGFVCPHENCEFSFSDESNLNLHQTYHLGNRFFYCLPDKCDRQECAHKLYQCDWVNCSFKALNRMVIVSHVRLIHLDLPSSLTIAAMSMHYNEINLAYREYEMLNDKRQNLNVPKNKTQEHNQRIQNDTLILKCQFSQCKMLFSNQKDLEVHEVEDHVRDKPFRCTFEQCGKAFEHKHQLDYHKKIHLNLNRSRRPN